LKKLSFEDSLKGYKRMKKKLYDTSKLVECYRNGMPVRRIHHHT